MKRKAPDREERDELVAKLEGAIADLLRGASIEEVEARHQLLLRVGPSDQPAKDASQLQRENARLKKLVADMTLIIEALKEGSEEP